MRKINEVIKNLKDNPLGEAFLMTAIHSYCLQVMGDDSDWGNSLVNKDLWQSLASEVLTMLGVSNEN